MIMILMCVKYYNGNENINIINDVLMISNSINVYYY